MLSKSYILNSHLIGNIIRFLFLLRHWRSVNLKIVDLQRVEINYTLEVSLELKILEYLFEK